MGLERKRVRLKCDLTRYRSGLVAGTLGWTLPYMHAQWGIMVQYDNGAVLDTLGNSLEVVDEKCPADEEGYQRWKAARLAKATRIQLDVGAMGGFYCLTYYVGKEQIHVFDKYEGDQLLDVFVAAGKRVKEVWPPHAKPYAKTRYRSPLKEAKERHAKRVQDETSAQVPAQVARPPVGQEGEQVPQEAQQAAASAAEAAAQEAT